MTEKGLPESSLGKVVVNERSLPLSHPAVLLTSKPDGLSMTAPRRKISY
jgi:hypothetical protein